jgi:site-specific DNA-cytosine methylase
LPSTQEREPQETPLRQAIEQWQINLDRRTTDLIHVGLKNLKREIATRPLGTASLFTGSDAARIVEDEYRAFWHCAFNLDLPTIDVYGAEKDEEKQQFLLQQSPNKVHLFADAKALTQMRALNLVTGKFTPPPSARILSGGFSCKSKSPLNGARSSASNCISENSEASTAVTFNYTEDVLRHDNSIEAFILENLQHMGDEDLAYIMSAFEKLNFAATSIVLDALRHGSLEERFRRYFVGFRYADGQASRSGLAAKLKCKVVEDGVRMMRLKEPLFLMDQFLMSDSEAKAFREHVRPAAVLAREKPDAAMKYKKEHALTCQHFGIDWPPTPEDVVAVLGASNVDRLSVRAGESVYVCAKAFPSELTALPIYEFLDANISLGWLLQGDVYAYPWKSVHCNTIVGSSVMVCRRGTVIKVLSGVEMLQLQGYDRSYIRTPVHATDRLLGNLAGNAFSLFSFGPIYGLVVPLLGVDLNDFPLGMVTATRDNLLVATAKTFEIQDDSDEAEDVRSQDPGTP